jgi:branched-chain amino acid transport system substrate-binding protein
LVQAAGENGGVVLNFTPPEALKILQAVLNVKNFRTAILCAPWYFGEAPLHIPNNIDWTTTPQDGRMVIKEDCFEISEADPDISEVRQIEAQDPSLIGE